MNGAKSRINYLIFTIYALVILAMIFISKPEVEYPMTIRLTLFVASMIPVFISPQYIIFSFTCIYAINSTSFCRLLPSDAYYYYLLILFSVFISGTFEATIRQSLKMFLGLAPFYFISMFYSDAQEFLLWWAVCLLFIPMLDHKNNLKLLAFSFPVTSLALSLLYLFNQAYFIFNYSAEMERSGWVNPNMFGGIIGVGVVIGVALILKQIKLNISLKEAVLLIFCVVISYIVVVLNASRGAFISTSLVSLTLIFMSNLKSRYKILVMTALAVFAIFLWQSGYFELLLYRLEADTADTAGSRSLIWIEKLTIFFNEKNPLYWLFGTSRTGAEVIGHTSSIQNMSTHNDFVTAIIGFGVPCFFYFIYLLLHPFFNTPKGHDRVVVGIIMIFVLLECFVLEPMFRGYISYIMLYIFLFSYSKYLKMQTY